MKNDKGVITVEDILLTISEKLERISRQLKLNNKPDFEFGYIDNNDFMNLLKISDRTALKLRKSKKLKYTKINGKIYYKLSDIKDMLENGFDEK